MTPISRRTLLAALPLAPYLTQAPQPIAAVFGARQETRAPAPWPTTGWPTAAPEEHGMDSATLDAVAARALAEVPNLSALLAVRDGYLVFERTYNAYQPAVPINIRSVTKSVTGTLVGIAIAEGAIAGIEQTVGELIPDRIPLNADPAIAGVTVGQLLTMTSGIAWPTSGEWFTLTGSENWVEFTLSQPVIDPSGSTYVYNTGGSHLLGVIIADATDTPLEIYAQDRLFDPLGITPGDWMRSPQGEPSAGSGLELTARDMAKLGYLYLREGEWDGDQIVPAEWVRAAITYQSAGDATGGYAAYGYQWWVTQTQAGYPADFALGYGGQHIFLVPDLDLVVVAGLERRVPPEELATPRYLIEGIAAAIFA